MVGRVASPAFAGLIALLVAVGVTMEAPQESKGRCRPDAKLIGQIDVSPDGTTGERTWWELTRDGLEAAGISEDDEQEEFIEGALGQWFDSLDDAIIALTAAARVADYNDDGLVCAYEIRGTRAHIGDSNYSFYLFTVRDNYFGK